MPCVSVYSEFLLAKLHREFLVSGFKVKRVKTAVESIGDCRICMEKVKIANPCLGYDTTKRYEKSLHWANEMDEG